MCSENQQEKKKKKSKDTTTRYYCYIGGILYAVSSDSKALDSYFYLTFIGGPVVIPVIHYQPTPRINSANIIVNVQPIIIIVIT